ncbi:molybdenum cofactor sulfurase 3-like [Paramacrobiotus metropolitanus]|uniref:molybdenum cofactor sulfurase 3-like n=1 Tax=Paramacrobiotus metropolitanus TaxID=2943436 RepID=UPI002445DEB0|nr:molybdenum cofactor sulfurase 3-like [Paramacrobiotus metropolitanus]
MNGTDGIPELHFNRAEEFPQLDENVYLDHAGATLFAKSQMEGWMAEMCSPGNLLSNPHSRHAASLHTSAQIGVLRRKILAHFKTDASSYSVIFTSGATASLKLVAENFAFGQNGIFGHLREIHTSVLGMRELAHSRGANVTCITDDNIAALCEMRDNAKEDGGKLFAYPGQCNFSGRRYPLEWIERLQKNNWRILLDAAALVSTGILDLSRYEPDFVVLSFYKIFGYPTGLGALLVHKKAESSLLKTYFGGGTVDIAVSEERFHVSRSEIHQRFEDGTINFLDILSLKHGFDALEKLGGGMISISSYTFSLTKYAYKCLNDLRHYSDKPVCEIYVNGDFNDQAVQGPIVTFNLKTASGAYVGFMEVEKVMESFKIQLRTGCFCNTGACQKYLGLTTADIKANYQAGHVCGDSVDLVNGRPTGAVRISFGYMSNVDDVNRFIQVIYDVFKEKNTQLRPVFNALDQQNRRISAMFMYPIKSCKAASISKWPIGEEGFVLDRKFYIQNSSGTCMTLKHNSRLAQISAHIDLDDGKIILSAPGIDDLDLTAKLTNGNREKFWNFQLPNGHHDNGIVDGRVCGQKVQAYDCGPDVSPWLSSVLCDDTYKLMRYHARNGSVSSSHSAANSAPFLVVCTASLDHLFRLIPMPHEFSRDDLLERMRANLVIQTTEPFEEDEWRRIRMGNVEMEVVEKCSRCQMVSVDPVSGKRTPEPLQSLIKLRGKEMCFGILVRPVGVHQADVSQWRDSPFLSVNDTVSVIA